MTEDIEARWLAAVESAMGDGRRSRTDAIKVVIAKQPNLHREFMATFNARRGHVIAAERIRRIGS